MVLLLAILAILGVLAVFPFSGGAMRLVAIPPKTETPKNPLRAAMRAATGGAKGAGKRVARDAAARGRPLSGPSII